MNFPTPGVVLGPAIPEGITLLSSLFKAAFQLLGNDDAPDRPDAPPPPDTKAGTNSANEDQAHKDNQEGAKGVGKVGQEAKDEAGKAAQENKELKEKLAKLQKEHDENIKRTQGGGSPETDSNTSQSIRDGLRDIRNLVGGAADSNAARAGGLPMPNLGALSNPLGALGGGGMPNLGGMMGGGMPGAQGGFPFGGGGAFGSPEQQGNVPNPFSDHTNPFADPSHGQNGPQQGTDPGTGPQGAHLGTPAGNQQQQGGPGHVIVADPAAANTRELVAHDGTKVTAHDDLTSAVLKHAMANPNSPNWAESSWQAATGQSLPGNGADPGKSVDINEIETGDIVRFDDHDELVFGDGKVMKADGTLQPIGEAIAAGNFKGIFRPEHAASPTSGASGSAAQTMPASTNPTETG